MADVAAAVHAPFPAFGHWREPVAQKAAAWTPPRGSPGGPACRGGRDLGLIISDSSGGANEAGIRDALAAVSAGIGRRGRYRSRVMEDVIFKDSRRDLLIQGADVAAYVIRKHCYGDPLFASWHAGLEACMWSIGGRVNGLGIKNYPVPR